MWQSASLPRWLITHCVMLTVRNHGSVCLRRTAVWVNISFHSWASERLTGVMVSCLLATWMFSPLGRAVYLYEWQVCRYPRRPKESVRSTVGGLSAGCELPDVGCWELTLGSLWEQRLFLNYWAILSLRTPPPHPAPLWVVYNFCFAGIYLIAYSMTSLLCIC